MSSSRSVPYPPHIEEIYRQLKRGLGHQLVTDENAEELIRRAERDGQAVLAQELREWKFPCKPDDLDGAAPASGSAGPVSGGSGSSTR
ncbi:MAG: hypothetical protein IT508_06665 [Burkholderiaceae bacterium]|nr:hypothetical protein [Burkholderiaceae bacterium]